MNQSYYSSNRRGVSAPFPIISALLIFALCTFIFFATFSNNNILVSGCLLAGDGLAVLILIISFIYSRNVYFSKEGYVEKAKLGRWVLWEESYVLSQILPFTVVESGGDDGSTYQIALNLKGGDRKLGMEYWIRDEALSDAATLNKVLLEASTSSKSLPQSALSQS